MEQRVAVCQAQRWPDYSKATVKLNATQVATERKCEASRRLRSKCFPSDTTRISQDAPRAQVRASVFEMRQRRFRRSRAFWMSVTEAVDDLPERMSISTSFPGVVSNAAASFTITLRLGSAWPRSMWQMCEKCFPHASPTSFWVRPIRSRRSLMDSIGANVGARESELQTLCLNLKGRTCPKLSTMQTPRILTLPLMAIPMGHL